MTVVNVTEVIIYIRNNNKTGADNMMLACLQNAVVNIDNEFLDITSQGDGKVSDLLQSGYSGSMQGSGVVQIDADANNTKLSGENLLKTTLDGATCLITYYAGGLEFYVNAKIASLSFQGNVGSLLKFSATFNFTSEIIRNTTFDLTNYYLVSSRVYRRVSTTTENTFTDSGLVGLYQSGYIRLIVGKNGVVLTLITGGDGDFPLDPNTVSYNPSTGKFNFGSDLVEGDVITILYY